MDAALDRVESWLEKAMQKIASLTDLARELGADYFLLLVGLLMAYRVISPNVPRLISAWERDRRHQRNHDRKMEELRASFKERVAKSERKRGR